MTTVLRWTRDRAAMPNARYIGRRVPRVGIPDDSRWANWSNRPLAQGRLAL